MSAMPIIKAFYAVKLKLFAFIILFSFDIFLQIFAVKIYSYKSDYAFSENGNFPSFTSIMKLNNA